jgi:hypothetical protein
MASSLVVVEVAGHLGGKKKINATIGNEARARTISNTNRIFFRMLYINVLLLLLSGLWTRRIRTSVEKIAFRDVVGTVGLGEMWA